MKKNSLVTIGIILVVIFLAIFILIKPAPETNEEVIKCIGENSVLYTQLGCSHCEEQEEMFGDNLKYLDIIDCFYEHEKCSVEDITATPTWIIKGEKHKGAKSIKKLQELTGCE
ncbi:MAG: hypothetical protein PVJ67_06015 [Candidatus Pacearchaeota archaeon]|jgi:hypothetical protein